MRNLDGVGVSGVRVIQMAGPPGAGKSTIATALGSALGAIVLDKDVVKTALLESDVSWDGAGPLAYEVFFAVAADLVARGHSVILDSPSFYPSIVQRGQGIAVANGAAYRMIECVCPDRELRGQRLRERPRRPSQPTELGDGDPRSHGPVEGWIVLETDAPFDQCVRRALAALEPDQPAEP